MQHPEEGLIHAWLDGALPADEAAALESHVATCDRCSEVVAEARGLIAASSRVIGYLDAVPANVIPARRAKRKTFLLRSAWPAAIAATIVVAVGIVATNERQDQGMEEVVNQVSLPPASPATAALDSAVPVSAPVSRRGVLEQSQAQSRAKSEAGAPRSNELPPASAAQQRPSVVAPPPPAPAPLAAVSAQSATGAAVDSTKTNQRERMIALRTATTASGAAGGGGGGGGGRGGSGTIIAARGDVGTNTTVAGAPPAIASTASGASLGFAMADRADSATLAAVVGCYELNASTDVLPARFGLVADSSALPGLRRVRYINEQGELTEPMADAGWTTEGGRIVIRVAGRGAVLTLTRIGTTVTGESANGPRTGRVISCR